MKAEAYEKFRRTISIWFRMAPHEEAMLAALAHTREVSRAQILRSLVRHAYAELKSEDLLSGRRDIVQEAARLALNSRIEALKEEMFGAQLHLAHTRRKKAAAGAKVADGAKASASADATTAAAAAKRQDALDRLAAYRERSQKKKKRT